MTRSTVNLGKLAEAQEAADAAVTVCVCWRLQ